MYSKLRVFLCHALEDKPTAVTLYDWLESIGAAPWLDKKNLLPGQDWELEIRKAVRSSDVVLVLSSRQLVTKAGYVQKEIKIALDEAEKQPEGAIYIIPVRLEACQMPDRLSHLQWVDLYELDGHQSLLASLQLRAAERGHAPLKGSISPPPGGTSQNSLADILTIGLGRGGLHPYKAGPGQWWVRLKIESSKSLKNCRGQLYDVLRLQSLDDPHGVPLPESEASILSWADGLFQPIDINPGDVPKYLDLAWRSQGDPPMRADELRIASSKDQGTRDTSSKDWGHRQDFIPLKPGFYHLIIRIIVDGYMLIERTFRLHWPGPTREDEIRLFEDGEPHKVVSLRPSQKSSDEPEVRKVITRQMVLNLKSILDTRFSLEELKDYCLHLDIDFENLPQRGKASVARELALYLERHDRVQEAIAVGKELRPDIEWDRLLAQ